MKKEVLKLKFTIVSPEYHVFKSIFRNLYKSKFIALKRQVLSKYLHREKLNGTKIIHGICK